MSTLELRAMQEMSINDMVQRRDLCVWAADTIERLQNERDALKKEVERLKSTIQSILSDGAA